MMNTLVSNPQRIATNGIVKASNGIQILLFQTLKGSLQTT